MAKLNVEAKKDIIKKVEEDIKVPIIAKCFNVTSTTIWKVIKNYEEYGTYAIATTVIRHK